MAQHSHSVTELISQFEASALSLQEKKGGKPPQLLPTPLQLYQVGKLLYDTEEGSSEAHVSLLKAYQALLEQLPVSYLKDVLFHDLNIGFSHNHDSMDAVHSICGLYAETPLACQTGFSVELCKAICLAHSIVKQQRNHDRESTSLLRTLSSLVLTPLNHGSHDNEQEDKLQDIMQFIQALTDDEHNTCFGDMVKWQEQTIPTKSLSVLIKSKFEDTPQREYLLHMLSSSPTSTSYQSTKTQNQQPQRQEYAPVKTVSTASEIQRRTQLVRDILPELGEGFVEAALSLFQGDVDRTVAALLESQTDPTSLPPILQMMDPKMPKRLTETTPNSYSLNDEEARRITKARLADIERKQEAEAFALGVVGNKDEYDDDYDDQYDGFDGGEDLGGMDGSSYDVDLDTIRTYNRAAMAAEAEGAFWEENRNLNRAKRQQEKIRTDGEAKSYRGPEKGKGGRLIGPDGRYLPTKKGGKKGKGKEEPQNDSGKDKPTAANGSSNGKGATEQIRIQQKRKNKNKAKIANHHRKDRAQKKAAQGM
jgi:hypothetical protein